MISSDGVQVWSLGPPGEQPKRVGSTIKNDETPTSVAIDDQAKWIALGMNNGDVRVMPTKP
jgi:hypothetical protein